MATSPAPVTSRARGRAGSPSRGRRVLRWTVRVLLLAAALLVVAMPALVAGQASGALSPMTASTAAGLGGSGLGWTGLGGTGRPAESGAETSGAVPSGQAQLTAAVLPAEPGGICQVPGIGDIGGLVGLCSVGSSGLIGDLNNICEPSLPQPELATGGIDAMIAPPGGAAGGKTLYDNYGIAGQFWAAHGLQCSDMTSLIGNNVAGMVFDAAKSMDRVTITAYQSAAGDNILAWLRSAVDKLISALGNAIYFPYLAPVVILGAIWLAWQGLVRKRATRTIEGTLWMVVACVAAIALIGRPADFTGIGTTVSNGVTGILNTAFSKLPAPADSNCLPVASGDPQSVTASYAFTSGNGLVDENANELWSVLVCKPWLWGELGTTAYATGGAGRPTIVNRYGRQLLWAQAIAANETPTNALIQAKEATYAGIASDIQSDDPAVYPLFQGNQWTTRLEIAFAAVFAALVAGLLILLIALTLIVLKLGFLLLLVVGPVFLIIGTHPGFGRVIAIRWFEMLVGVLLKQVAVAVVLSVLLYCYSLIMGTSDTALPWALKILMIALVTVAAFIYRKPFQHLFSAVGYGAISSTERAEYSLREATSTFRRSRLDAAAVAIPGVAGYRATRWARRNPAAAASPGAAAGGAAAAAETSAGAVPADAHPSRLRPDAPPPADADGDASPGSRRAVTGAGGASLARTRTMPEADSGPARAAPPLDLPPRPGSPGTSSPDGAASSGPASGWSRGAGRSAAGGPAVGGPAVGGPALARPRTGAAAGPVASGGATRAPGRPAAPRAPVSRAPVSSAPVSSAPVSTPASGAPAVNGGAPRTSRSASSGSSSRAAPSGPSWPSSGWTAAGAQRVRTRSGSGPKPAAPASASHPAEAGAGHPAEGSGGQGAGGAEDPPGRPFWLRPARRDK